MCLCVARHALHDFNDHGSLRTSAIYQQLALAGQAITDCPSELKANFKSRPPPPSPPIMPTKADTLSFCLIGNLLSHILP